ncbi:MAG: dicarboxylate/amino acid:cation symporter [Gammaproteobacteria bacterium]|nr:dicarboxylate/amino acid:cation symporter [Gammaproteobacteria bacterium]
MCVNKIKTSMQSPWSKPLLYLAMILLGIWCGMADVPILKNLGLVIAEMFVKVFKCISLPIITLSIIVTLSQYSSEGSMRYVWRRTMLYTLTTTLIAATVSAVLYVWIHPSMVGMTDAVALPVVHHPLGYWDYVLNLIPSSFVTPFVENQVMSALLIGIVVGIGIRFIPESELQHTLVQTVRALHALLMVMTNWVIRAIPIALFGFITTTVVQLKSGGAIRGIGEYLLIVVLANLVQGLVILPLWLRRHGIAPFKAMRGMLPALSVAFFSKSSVGTLPVTIEMVEKSLQVRPEISRFVLPLCTGLNMNGCAAFIFATVIYLMQNHGIEVTLPMMALWILISTLAAIGNAGVPMGCFFLSASLLASMNIPITLMGVILPFYTLIDMLETALNVWSDACVAKVVNDRHEM